jgi:adenylate cyclase
MRAIEEQLATDPDDSRALQLAPSLAAALGQPQRARVFAEQALRARPDDIGTVYNAACTYALIGDPDRAVELLARAVDLGWSSAEWLAHDPDVDSLRADPRFQRIQSALRQPTGS